MRPLFIAIFWFFIATCYGLEVIAYELPVVDASPYLNTVEEHKPAVLVLSQSEEFPLPVSSRTRAGKLTAHPIRNNVISQPLFVVGDDALSRQWLIKHAKKINELHAVGFVTNITTSKALHELSQLVNIPLQAVDIDDLAHLLNAPHYPFMVSEGVVWQ